MNKEFLKIENAAKLIDVSPWTLRNWIKEGKIRTYRFGGAIRIKESDLLAFAKITQTINEMCETILEAEKYVAFIKENV